MQRRRFSTSAGAGMRLPLTTSDMPKQNETFMKQKRRVSYSSGAGMQLPLMTSDISKQAKTFLQQKRRFSTSSGSGMQLPLTMPDIPKQNETFIKQKRRGSYSSDAGMQLPLTTSDTSKQTNTFFTGNNRSHKLRTRYEKRNERSSVITCVLFVFVMIFIGFSLSYKFGFVSHHPVISSTNTGIDASKHILLSGVGQQLHSLAQFKALEKPLAHSKLVGLYFAASWCGMSTPVSNTLEKLFDPNAADSDATSLSNRILTSQDIDNEIHKDFSIVYISSDHTAEDMAQYARSNWMSVAFDTPDRNDLKKHYKTCAQVEMEELEITSRKFQIPTLMIVDTVTHRVIPTNGVEDLKVYGKLVLDHWLQIQSLTRALEDKYDE